MRLYKVWIEIEEYDTETETGTTRDAPGCAIVSFPDYKTAYRFAERMNAIGEALADSSEPAAIREPV